MRMKIKISIVTVLFLLLMLISMAAIRAESVRNDPDSTDRWLSKAHLALEHQRNNRFSDAWTLWDELAADPQCPIRSHAEHLAAQTRMDRLNIEPALTGSEYNQLKNEIYTRLKHLAAETDFSMMDIARQELLSFLEHEKDWTGLLDVIPDDTGDQSIMLSKVKALLHTGDKTRAEALLRPIWLKPHDQQLVEETDRLYRMLLEEKNKPYPSVETRLVFSRARSLDEIGNKLDAAELYRMVMDSGISENNRSDASLFLAKILSDIFRTRDALEMYNDFLKRYPGHTSTATILFRKSILFRRLGDDTAYLDMVSRVQKDYPSSKWRDLMLLGRGDYWRSHRDWDKAETDYLAVIRSGKTSRDSAWWKYAWTAFNRGNYRQAAERLRKMKTLYDSKNWHLPIQYWLISFSDLANSKDVDPDAFKPMAIGQPWDYYGQRSAEKAGLGIPGPRSDPIPLLSPDETSAARAALILEDLLLWDRAAAEWNHLSGKTSQTSEAWLFHRVNCMVMAGDIPATRRLILARWSYDVTDGQIPAEFARMLYPIPAALESFYISSARSAGLDPLLAVAVTLQESGFDRKALSKNMAGGLMQVMPDLFNRFASAWPEKPGVDEYQRPEYNIRAGVEYLAWLIKRFDGSIARALAGYNAGEHRVDEWIKEYPYSDEIWIEHIPFQQTRMFVKRVLENYTCYRVIYPERALTNVSQTDDFSTGISDNDSVAGDDRADDLEM